MATEVELKLHYCSPEDIRRFTSHPLISAAVEITPSKRLQNTYFDTVDLSLHHERVALRIRVGPTKKLQTIKCASKSVAGLSSRPEWETPYTGTFEFDGIDVCKVREFLENRRDDLQPIFATNFDRRTWKIELSKKATILVMLDIGKVISGDESSPISEVELELVQGQPRDLFDFAAALASDLPLIPSDISKAERGYQLFLKQNARPKKARSSPIKAKHTTQEAFQLLASQDMQMLQVNLLGMLTTNDQEYVHQYRVSLRRLNSLIKAFQPFLPERFKVKWSKRFKELTHITGDLRDMNVIQSRILEPMLEARHPVIRQQVKATLVALNEVKPEVEKHIEQLRYGGPVLLLARDLIDLNMQDYPKNLTRFSQTRIAELHKRAAKRLSKLTKNPNPENAHLYRIALKHLRYTCEFFSPLFGNSAMLEYARELAELQDSLGFINDFYVAMEKLKDWSKRGLIDIAVRQTVDEWHGTHIKELLSHAIDHAHFIDNSSRPVFIENA